MWQLLIWKLNGCVLQPAGALKLTRACLLKVVSLQTACAITHIAPISMTITCSTTALPFLCCGLLGQTGMPYPHTRLSQGLRDDSLRYAHFILTSFQKVSHRQPVGCGMSIERLEGKTEVGSWWKESVWHQMPRLIPIQTRHSTCLEGKSRWGLIPPVIPSTSAFSHWAQSRVTCPVEGSLLVDCI